MQSISSAAQRFLGNLFSASRSPASGVLNSGKARQSALRSGLSSFLNLHAAHVTVPDQAPLWLLRKEMTQAIADCPQDARERLTVSIYRARTGMDLWLLRSDIFQCVSRERGQHEARRRINELRALFANLIPKKQLVSI